MYNDSITVRRPAPRDHPSHFTRHRLPQAPETCTTFTRGCMTPGVRPTHFERPPGAHMEFSWGSGIWLEGLYVGYRPPRRPPPLLYLLTLLTYLRG